MAIATADALAPNRVGSIGVCAFGHISARVSAHTGVAFPRRRNGRAQFVSAWVVRAIGRSECVARSGGRFGGSG